MTRRWMAALALLVGAATCALGLVVAVREFPRGLVLLVLVLVAMATAWYGVVRRGVARAVGLALAALAVAGALVLVGPVGRLSSTC